jgi:hypothetical protein
MSTPPTVIIAHGAFHQAAQYIDFDAALHEVGLKEVRIPQLPSASHNPPEDAFAQDVAVLKKTMQSCLSSGRDVMLIAHSYGAMPLSDALADIPHLTNKDHVKVLGVIFVAAMVPEEGEDLGKAMKTGVAPWVNINVRLFLCPVPSIPPLTEPAGQHLHRRQPLPRLLQHPHRQNRSPKGVGAHHSPSILRLHHPSGNCELEQVPLRLHQMPQGQLDQPEGSRPHGGQTGAKMRVVARRGAAGERS